MSRSNTKTARDLRQSEFLQTHKKILKAGGSAAKQEVGALAAALADNNYLKKIEDLKKFNKKNKQIQKITSHKSEWIDEYHSLQRHSDRIEKSIEDIWHNVVASSLFKSSSISDAMSEYSSYSSNQNEYRKETMSQIRDLKAMLILASSKSSKTRIDNSIMYTSASRNASDQTVDDDADESIQRKAAISMFAEVLLMMRNTHSSAWDHLRHEEEEETRQLRSLTRNFCTMQSQYRTERNNTRLNEELEEEEDDTPEILAILDELRQKIYALDEQHKNDLEELSNDRKHINASAVSVSLDANSEDFEALSPFGGWSESDHVTFTKVVKRAHAKGMQRSKMTELISAQLPHRSHEEISSHEDWYRGVVSISERRKIKSREYEEKREKMLADGRKYLESVREQRRIDEKELEERRLLEIRIKELQNKLELQRAERILLMQGRLNEIQQLRSKIDAENLLMEEKRQAELIAKKELIKKYQQERAVILEEQKAMEYQSQQLEAERKKRELELNRPKILERELLFKKKMEERKAKEEQLLQEELKRIDTLNRLAEQVPYYEALQNVESKLDHVTTSAQSHIFVKGEDPTRGYIPLYGFTDKKVFQNAKFRLGLALRAAGVHQSAAARDTIANLCPRPQAPW